MDRIFAVIDAGVIAGGILGNVTEGAMRRAVARSDEVILLVGVTGVGRAVRAMFQRSIAAIGLPDHVLFTSEVVMSVRCSRPSIRTSLRVVSVNISFRGLIRCTLPASSRSSPFSLRSVR